MNKFVTILLLFALLANTVLPLVEYGIAIEWAKVEETGADDTDDDNKEGKEDKVKTAQSLTAPHKYEAALYAAARRSKNIFHSDFSAWQSPCLSLLELPPEPVV